VVVAIIRVLTAILIDCGILLFSLVTINIPIMSLAKVTTDVSQDIPLTVDLHMVLFLNEMTTIRLCLLNP